MVTMLRPAPVAETAQELRLTILRCAGAGFPSPAPDWAEDAISLVGLLCLDRPASYVFRVSGSSMVDAGLHDHDVVVVDRDTMPAHGHIVIAVADGGFVVRQLTYRQGVPYLGARNAQMTCPVTVADETAEVWSVIRAGVRGYQR